MASFINKICGCMGNAFRGKRRRPTPPHYGGPPGGKLGLQKGHKRSDGGRGGRALRGPGPGGNPIHGVGKG